MDSGLAPLARPGMTGKNPMSSNSKPKPNAKEAPTEPLKRAVAGCLRALARKPDLDVTYAAERLGLTAGKVRLPEPARKLTPAELKASESLSPEIAKAITVLRGDRVGSHVNSGPPGFVNGGGHANFDPKVALDTRMQQVTLPDGRAVRLPAEGAVDITIGGFRIKR